MAKNFRNASTGRFVTASAASRNTPGTLGEARGKDAPSGVSYRSAKTGRFVTEATARRHPGTTVREGK
ncbi:hypothetical protein [Actinomyces dentalis]|jgi:hypothetical protein|uniref:hypothetical protein n=1 Tax=Actinomyces dentalis TaxID=272548 RepID=UPI0009FD0278|nr:hypothetical protein [Actinomyces dentalis]